MNGTVWTSGAGAFGIIAQSVGGGGGIGVGPVSGLPAFLAGAGSGTGGDVSVTVNGGVYATGAGATAITAHSEGPDGNGDISVALMSGSVVGGSGGAGVSFLAGRTNRLENHGLVTTMDDIDGLALSGTTGDEAIDNAGGVIGSVELGTGTSSFANRQGAFFYAGPNVDLGGGILDNAGLLAPGGPGSRMTTTLSGSLVQGATGVLDVTLDPRSGSTDRILVSGTADVGGTFNLGIINAGNAKPGSFRHTVIEASGGIGPDRPVIVTPPSAVATYSVTVPDANRMDLAYSVNFAPAGLDPNQRSVALTVDAIQRAGIGSFAPVAAALYEVPDMRQLRVAYDSLSGEGVAAIQQTGLDFLAVFSSSLTRRIDAWRGGLPSAGLPLPVMAYAPDPSMAPFLGAPGDGAGAAGSSTALWASPLAGRSRQRGDAQIGSAGLEQRGYGVAGGLDGEVRDDVFAGVAASGTWSNFTVNERSTSGAVTSVQGAAYAAMRAGDGVRFRPDVRGLAAGDHKAVHRIRGARRSPGPASTPGTSGAVWKPAGLSASRVGD